MKLKLEGMLMIEGTAIDESQDRGYVDIRILENLRESDVSCCVKMSVSDRINDLKRPKNGV